MKKFIFVLFISVSIISGCEKGTVPEVKKTRSLPESEKISQILFKGMYKQEKGKDYYTDCSSAGKFRLDPNGETIALKKIFEDAVAKDSISSLYVEFEGFFSTQSSKVKKENDSVIIPTRLLITNSFKKCF